MENVFVIRVNFDLEPDLTEEEVRKIIKKEKKRINARTYYVKNIDKIKQYKNRQDVKDRDNARRRQRNKEEENFSMRKNFSNKKSFLKHREKRLQHQHEHYQKNKEIINAKGKQYRDSFLGKVLSMYTGMVLRNKERGFVEIISKQDFINFALNNQQYKQLYNNWILNNKEYKLIPSIDRIDVTKPYVLNNIQFLTVSDNSKKAHLDYPKGCKVKATKGNEVKYFNSIVSFNCFLGYNHSSSSHLNKREKKHIRGWDYEILNNKKGDE